MTACNENVNLVPASSLHWSDLMFVLSATCMATVAAVLNLGLLTSIIFRLVVAKHLITAQLCICGMFASVALSCHVDFVWKREKASIPLLYPIICRTWDLVTLFSHCSFISLTLLELRFPHRKAVIPLLSIIAWCMIALVSLTAGMHCSVSSAVLMFCFYVLHIPLIVMIMINLRTPCTVSPSCSPVSPLSQVVLRHYSVRRCVPQIILFFIITMPQAFFVATAAWKLKPFSSVDAWCSLMTSTFAVLCPVLNIVFQSELGHAVVELISCLCRRK